jgi:hypothetical protein
MLSAPSLLVGSVEPHYPTGLQREVRLAAASSATGGRAALAALAATEVAEQLPPEFDQFVDELTGLLTCPITVHQREKLQAALVGAIDARLTALFG